jgi:hypothetical protein
MTPVVKPSDGDIATNSAATVTFLPAARAAKRKEPKK